ncbi:MAG TPA: hypothetical protein VMT54_16055 [Candidatus Cybelea sp.]|nr:hypothetical protein [Candidatus Cybelea sp.]
MKLSGAQVKAVLAVFETAPAPQGHPALTQLERTFGKHTFFLGPHGLHTVEPNEKAAEGEPNAYLVRLASWADDKRSNLAPHPPAIEMPVTIDLTSPPPVQATAPVAAPAETGSAETPAPSGPAPEWRG